MLRLGEWTRCRGLETTDCVVSNAPLMARWAPANQRMVSYESFDFREQSKGRAGSGRRPPGLGGVSQRGGEQDPAAEAALLRDRQAAHPARAAAPLDHRPRSIRWLSSQCRRINIVGTAGSTRGSSHAERRYFFLHCGSHASVLSQTFGSPLRHWRQSSEVVAQNGLNASLTACEHALNFVCTWSQDTAEDFPPSPQPNEAVRTRTSSTCVGRAGGQDMPGTYATSRPAADASRPGRHFERVGRPA